MISLSRLFVYVLLFLGYNSIKAQDTILLISTHQGFSDTTTIGDTIKVDIFLGSPNKLIEGINSIEIDITIDSSYYEFYKIDFQNFSNNFFGNQGLDYNFELDTTALDLSILRLKYNLINNDINVSGFGQLGRIKLIVEDDVPGIYRSLFKTTRIYALNSSNETVEFNTSSTEVILLGKTLLPVINNALNPNAIKVYPNPTREALYIENKFLSIPKIEIYDTTGEQLITTQGLAIDIAFLPKGLYFLNLIFEEGSITYKIIKE